MGIDSTNRQYKDALSSLGRSGLNILFPNDFEYYMLSLELVTFDDRTIDYFAFPVMPENITKTEYKRINIKKAQSSTTVINSKAFIPSDIVIKGSFGRQFKTLISPSRFTAIQYSIANGMFKSYQLDPGFVNKVPAQFLPFVKTGYGAVKILQAIIDKSDGIDSQGKSFKLYMYNPTLGENYLVVPSKTPLVLEQNETNNMIWEYTLNLSIVAPLDAFSKEDRTSSTKILGASALQNVVNKFGSNLRRILE